MLALEAGSFEITTAFAGALGVEIVSAHSTLLGICTYTFISFPFAVATAGEGVG
jgi:MATE family multidrug resistance protein